MVSFTLRLWFTPSYTPPTPPPALPFSTTMRNIVRLGIFSAYIQKSQLKKQLMKRFYDAFGLNSIFLTSIRAAWTNVKGRERNSPLTGVEPMTSGSVVLQSFTHRHLPH